MKDIWIAIRGLSIPSLFSLLVIAIQNPFKIYPTLVATQETIAISFQQYGHAQGKNGKANAFRHALWNILIGKAIYKKTGDMQTSIRWAEKITDLHEYLFPNVSLEKHMDLHNNRVGRNYFVKLHNSGEDMLSYLVEQTKKAVLITDVEMALGYKEDLIYISEEE